MSNEYSIAILGGGLGGIYAGYNLKENNVCILNADQKMGGVFNGIKWKDFYIDKGCHLFDGNQEELNFYEEVGGMESHEVKYGSYNTGKLTNEIATPEINEKEKIDKIIIELKKQNLNKYDSKRSLRLDRVFENIFGVTAGKYMSKIQKKFTGLDAEEVNGSEYEKFSVFHRLRVGDDKTSMELKQLNNYLDNVVCASLSARGLGEYQVSMYPSNGGATNFGSSAEKYFLEKNLAIENQFKINHISEDQGGYVITSEDSRTIKCEKILSTVPYPQLLRILGKQSNKMPKFISYKLVAIEVDLDYISDTYYVQDFDINNTIYRSSNMGKYSKQVSDKRTTFVLAEIPYVEKSPDIDIELIKEELILHQIFDEKTRIIDYEIFEIKNAIPINAEIEELKLSDNIYTNSPKSFDMKSKLSEIKELCINI